MKILDWRIQFHKRAIERIVDKKVENTKKKLNKLEKQLGELSSTNLLNLIEGETDKRKLPREKIRGTNDIAINKINMILKDEFWMVKIYLLFDDGEYINYTKDFYEANEFVNESMTRKKIEEIVDLRDIY